MDFCSKIIERIILIKFILFNKPYNVLSQFTDKQGCRSKRQTLSDFIQIKDFYAAGRLDKDSEGLLILTNNGFLQARISDPRYKVKKTYWVQVEGIPTESGLNRLRNGITLSDGNCLPAEVSIIPEPKDIWERKPPIRYRKLVGETWLEISISEGKNRQVRRMTAAIGNPTLRLIRYSIGDWNIRNLGIGEYSKQLTWLEVLKN